MLAFATRRADAAGVHVRWHHAGFLDQAIEQTHDEALRARIAREVELLRDSRRFGLVFDRHVPESVRLPDHPVRKASR